MGTTGLYSSNSTPYLTTLSENLKELSVIMGYHHSEMNQLSTELKAIEDKIAAIGKRFDDIAFQQAELYKQLDSELKELAQAKGALQDLNKL